LGLAKLCKFESCVFFDCGVDNTESTSEETGRIINVEGEGLLELRNVSMGGLSGNAGGGLCSEGEVCLC
jgi:hypothetical protein